MIQVIFEKIHPDAILPTKATEGSACWDVYACEDGSVSDRQVSIISTGLKIQIPKGYEIVVRPRSGMAFKEGIMIVNSPGTIDSDYRGEIKIALTSCKIRSHIEYSTKGVIGIPVSKMYPYLIKKGDRIAQIKLQEVLEWTPIEGAVTTDTERAENGFGSTGA